MASPCHISAAAGGGSGNKENISENEVNLLDLPVLHKEVAVSAKGKKKTAGFNLRKSIAWNPAFFTEEGVLDNSELSVLTGSELMANGSPSSGINGRMSTLCRSGKYNNTHVLKQVAEKSPGKVSAKYSRAENQGRRLFSLEKTPQRDVRKEPVVIQKSARSFQKCIPRVPAGATQKKVSNSTSTAPMSRIPKKSLSSLPMAPRSTTPPTTVLKSNKKLAPVKTEHIHRVPGVLPKSKVDFGSSMETDVVPAFAAKHEQTSGSVKLKNLQMSPSSFVGTTSSVPKPSALRMPSPSVGFFTQEKAQTSHGNAAERNVGRFSPQSTSSLAKPPRYKLPEDLKAGLHLSKVLSTNCTTASTFDSLPIITENNTNTLVTSEKRPLSKIISTYSRKSRDVNYQERPEVYHPLAGSGATTQPLSSEKNDGARNSVPIVYKDTPDVEGRDLIKEIEPVDNSLSLKAPCFSTMEATYSSTKPTVGSKLSPSCISSQRHDLSCQSKMDNGTVAPIHLENSSVGERAIPVSLSEGESCTLDIDSFQNSDSCDHHNMECATSMDSVEYALCADQMPPSCSSSNGNPDLADRKYILNDSLYDGGESVLTGEQNTDGGTNKASVETEHPQGDSSLSEEPNTDGGTKPETNKASAVAGGPQGYSALSEPNTDGGTEPEANEVSVVTEDPLLHVGCEHNHSFKRTKCSPAKTGAAMACVEGQNVLSAELNLEDEMVVGSNRLLAQEGTSHIEKDKAVDRPRTNTILRDHLKNLVPFTEEWLAVMEACGQEVLEQKSGAVQHSPPEKTAPEPSPWSPVKRKAQDVGPFDCTKYSKSVRTSVSP